MDRLGPYSVRQLRQLAHEFPPTRANGTRVLNPRTDLPSDPGALLRMVEEGPVVLLWREVPTFGHFILLHLRQTAEGPDLELFDPLGTSGGADSWADYMDDPKGLNGGGLRGAFQQLYDDGLAMSYNGPRSAPQEETANSCGLWCLLRAGAPGLSPSEFDRAVGERT